MTRASFTATAGTAAIVAAVAFGSATASGQGSGAASKPAARSAAPAKKWTAPKTAWGEPDLQGYYTDRSELGTPFEKPKEFEGRRLEDISEAELAQIMRNRQEKVVDDARPEGN